jgi:hypothetical protein
VNLSVDETILMFLIKLSSGIFKPLATEIKVFNEQLRHPNSIINILTIENLSGGINILNSTLINVTIAEATGGITLTNCIFQNVKINGLEYAN